ncbi:MAG: bifunctional riboflavin kinase/FAD synthetase [Pseudomonadota bacterium]
MLELLQPETVPAPVTPRVVVIGNFDGFHRGHQEVVSQAHALSARLGGTVWLMTFEPHPREYFAPQTKRFVVADKAIEMRLAEALGFEGHYTLKFDATLAQKSPEEFVDQHVLGDLQASGVVLGHDFRFGKARAGSAASLAADGRFEVVEADAIVDEGGEAISSTRIRQALKERHLSLANGLLGYRYMVSGSVEHGDKRGRTLGFPTANIHLAETCPLAGGAYAVTVRIKGVVHRGVANYGRRPTFGDKPPMLEVHVLDFDGDLYGETLIVAFHSFLREEKRFDGPEQLIGQLKLDQEEAIASLAAAQPLSELDLKLGMVHSSLEAV